MSLGITDSVSIAEFLHYSPQTIYNYRLRVRHCACIPEKDFAATVAAMYGKGTPTRPFRREGDKTVCRTRKTAKRRVKGRVLNAKRPPFIMRKAAFNRHIDYEKLNERQVSSLLYLFE